MALLPILEFPDPRLRTVAKPVAEVTDEIRQLVKDMLETMYAAPGIGLAASQVDRHIRLLVLDISEDQSKPQVFINPTFEPISAETKAYDEGCLSIPGFYESVERPDLIRVSALDLQGQPQTTEADGLLSSRPSLKSCTNPATNTRVPIGKPLTHRLCRNPRICRRKSARTPAGTS